MYDYLPTIGTRDRQLIPPDLTSLTLALAYYNEISGGLEFGVVLAAHPSHCQDMSDTLEELCNGLRTNDPSITELSIRIEDRSRETALLKALDGNVHVRRSRWT
jgi:hypothetical protein